MTEDVTAGQAVPNVDQRIVVLAGGDGVRWGNYLGTQKHLIEVDGQSLIARVVQQFGGSAGSNVQLVVSERNLSHNLSGVAQIFRPKSHRELDKIRNGLSLVQGHTLILFGDVWFSEAAARRISEDDATLRFYLRSGASMVTGKKYGEIFAFRVHETELPGVLGALDVLEQIGIEHAGTWSLLQYLITGSALSSKAEFNELVKGNLSRKTWLSDRPDLFLEIDDETEDFDFPNDFLTWSSLREARKELG